MLSGEDASRAAAEREIVTAVDAARAALAAYAGGPAVAVATRLDGAAAGRRLLCFETGEARGSLGTAELDARALTLARRALDGGEPATASVDGVRLYVESHRAPEALIIVGAGHIAVPLARLGVMLGYRVTVLDDREDFATPARFPAEADVRRADFSDPFHGVAIGPRSHVLLVTRAHRYDFDCLRRLLDGDVVPRYIGMIGSRRRVKAAFRALLDAGVPRERLARVSAPVGLDIGAETPEEIAVSIAAELVWLRRAGSGARDGSVPGAALRAGAEAGARGAAGVPTLSEKERVLDRLLPEGGHG